MMDSDGSIEVGDVSTLVRGVTYEKSQSSSIPAPGMVPLLRATNIARELNFSDLIFIPEAAVSENQYLQPGDIVIAASSGSLNVVGKAAPVRNPWHGTFGAFCFVLRPNQSLIRPLFLSYYFQTSRYRFDIARFAAGININNLRQEHIKGIRLPAMSLCAQDRVIAGIETYLTRLDKTVATLERVQLNLKRYRASVLKAAVEGRLVPTEAEVARAEKREYEPASELLKRILVERRRRWEEAELAKMKASGKVPQDDKWKRKYEEPPAAPHTGRLPPLPEGWCWASPAQFFTWSSGDFLPKKDQRGGEFPVYGGNGINGLHDRPLTNEPTLVIGRVGAQCGNIHLTEGPAWITDNAIYAAGETDHACLPYWRLVLSLQNLNAAAGGTGQPYVNQKHLNNLIIPLAPEAEQRRIAEAADDKLSLIEHLDADVLRTAQRSLRLRQSILKWAFEGKLVDQDPNDEPASVLLERIRAERAATRPVKKTTARSRGKDAKEKNA
jgi:type I restriction enzyme S subunit